MHRGFCGEGSGGKMAPLPSAPHSPPPAIESSTAASTIGVNLRVTGHCSQGGRKYMEDFFSVAYHQSENAKDLEYAFVGIYDGHGGSEAAAFAKEHLMMEIINQKLFWSDSDQDVLRAIREGYIATHYAMWREQEKWPKTATGLPSTAGTTATVAFIRHEKIYIGHVGDSGIVLGYQNSDESFWRAKQLTQDHKPENASEKARIVNSGGKVVVKSGVPRVVWNRPRTGHKGPVRRSTPIDEIPFLAVARSLGDLWSFNSALNEFVVSPDPDVKVIKINPKTFRCLIFGTDGLWNVVSPSDAVDTVREKEVINDRISRMRGETNTWCNPSKGLVEKALKTWGLKKMRADNTSVVTVILYPPGLTPTKENSLHDCNSSCGLEYTHTSTEIYPDDSYVHMSCYSNHQKFVSNSMYELTPQYDMDSFSQSHQLPHYDIIAPSPTMRLHLHQQQYLQDGYMPSLIDPDDRAYTNNYCDTNAYLYYDDQASSTYVNTFAESYRSLLASNPEQEDNNRSNDSRSIQSRNEKSNDSVKSNPSDYHSYHSLHHTGLAGHDRVQHHCPNNEHEMEQLLYQEQCMSAEEGYSLTKLETRGEQQRRGSSSKQNMLNCVQTFQIFGGDRNDPNGTIYSQYKNSNFFSGYEDVANSYEPNLIANSVEEGLTQNERMTSLCIERLDSFEVEKLTTDATESNSIISSLLEVEMETEEEQGHKEDSNGTIQIHEISSSVLEEPSLPTEPMQSHTEEIQKTLKEQSRPTDICESIMDSTPLKKPSIPKLVLYPIVPNENHRTSRASIQQYPRTFEKRMLRSMTVDYSKRTLRSRNSLSKDLKAKNAGNTSLRRSTIVQSKFNKTLQSSLNAENSSVISRKSLNLRSREITTTTQIWSTAETSSMCLSSTSSASQRQRRKSKQVSFCNNSGSSEVVNTPRISNSGSSSSGRLMTAVGASMPSGSFNHHHLKQQVTMSFAKRTNLKSNGWGSTKSTMQTRNRVHKRLSR